MNTTRNKKIQQRRPATVQAVPPVKGVPAAKSFLLKPAAEGFVILLFALAVYANTLGHGFVLDDMMMITHNQFTKEGFQGIGKILTEDAFTGFHGENKNLLPGGRYRPLSQVMFAMEYGLFGANPFPGHLINILLYGLACFILYKALHLLFEGYKVQIWRFSLPFVITLLFAVHPLHTEVVANIKGRDEILGLLGFAILVMLAMKYLLLNQRKYLVWIVPVFFLSLLSKESALTYLAAIPVMVIFRQKGFSKQALNTLLALVVGLGAYVMLRIGSIGIPSGGVVNQELLNDPFLYAAFPERIATLFYTWIRYVGLVIFPHPLTHDYYPWHITYKSFGNGVVLLSVLFFIGMAWYSMKKIRRPDMPALGFILFVVLFSSQSNLLVNIGTFMNERFVFVALLGLLVMLSWALVIWLPSRMKQNSVLPLLIFGVLVLGFSAKTISRNSAWKDDFTLFTTDVQISENSAKVNISAGGMLLERAQKSDDEPTRAILLDQALLYLSRGVEKHPDYVQGQILLGNAKMMKKDFQGAWVAYHTCLKMNPLMADPLNNASALGKQALLFKDFNAAGTIFQGLLELHPTDIDAMIGYSEAIMNARQYDQAEHLLDSLLKIAPEESRIHHLLGQLYGRHKASDPATTEVQRAQYVTLSKRYLEKAVGLEPENYGMIENLAIACGMSGDFGRALELFEKAVAGMKQRDLSQTTPNSSKQLVAEDYYRIYKNIGDTYGMMRNEAALIKHYELALQYKPGDPAVTATLEKLRNR